MRWSQCQPEYRYQELAQVEQLELNDSENEQENFSDSSDDNNESD